MAGEIEKTSENWNVAVGLSNMKILKYLVEMDKFVIIAQYGVEQIEDSFIVSPLVKTEARIRAMDRLIDCMKLVYENSYFACKKVDKEALDSLIKRLNAIQDVLGAISKNSSDQRNNSNVTVIDERHFNLCLNKLRDIKRELLIPLNNNGLIFMQSDETNLQNYKDRLINEG